MGRERWVVQEKVEGVRVGEWGGVGWVGGVPDKGRYIRGRACTGGEEGEDTGVGGWHPLVVANELACGLDAGGEGMLGRRAVGHRRRRRGTLQLLLKPLPLHRREPLRGLRCHERLRRRDACHEIP